MATTTTDKAAGLPDGLHASEGVEYLARLEGFQGDHLPAAVILSLGFSEATGFFRESKGRGYYMVTEETCTCPSFMYRGGPCKHQRRLAEELQKRTAGPSLPSGVVAMTSEEMEARRRRIEERNATRAAAPAVEEVRGRGFCNPDEVRA